MSKPHLLAAGFNLVRIVFLKDRAGTR